MNFLKKIVSVSMLQEIINSAKNKGLEVALCHGTFDLLHPGHLQYFQKARMLSDLLVVTITSDSNVNKGPNRPVFQEKLRAESIASLEYVDFVAINNAPDAVELIKTLRPSFYVKGSDYVDHSKDKTGMISLEVDAIEKVEGKMHYTDGIVFSSTKLLQYLK